LTGTLTSIALQTGASLPNQLEIATFPSGTTPSSTPGTTNGCGYSGQLFTCVSANDGQSFTVQDVEGIGGLTGQTYTTVALANPISVTQNQWVAIQFTITSGNPTFGILMKACSGSSGAGTGCGAIVASGVWDVCLDFGTASPAIGSTATSVGLINGFCGAQGMMVGASFTPTGTTTQTVTQCYGNCGSPAITLANTNSTHTINFNQSITLFYEFQSNLNGFIINVTTNIAKQYNNGIGVIEAIYTIPSCPVGATPFSTTCPGYLASGWNVVGNPGKGRVANGNYLIPVANGQWVGISITATMSGLDVNDTNTGVPLFQTSGGGCACPPPPVISQSTLLNAASKMGLWSWIRGNVITAAPPSSIPGSCQSFADIDCLFPAIVNSFCTNFTQSCQTSSAIFWIVILSIFAMFILQFGAARLLPGSKFIAGGEIFILLFVSFILMFSGLGLLPIWIPVLIFFIVALMMGKHTGRYL